MSGTEDAINQFTELNNILTMIVTISLIVTALAALIRYLRSQVTSKVDNFRNEMKLQFDNLSTKIQLADKDTEQRSLANEQSLQQVKWLTEQMQKTVSEQVASVRQDMERLEERRFKDVQMVRDRLLKIESVMLKMNGNHDSNSSDSEISKE